MPAGTDGQLVFTYTYDSPGCIDVGLVISNAISLFATATKVTLDISRENNMLTIYKTYPKQNHILEEHQKHHLAAYHLS